MMFNFGQKKVSSTPLSHFVKSTSSSEKKKVYTRVIVAANRSQNSTLARAQAM